MNARENMQPKYPGRPPWKPATNAFERSLRMLLGRPTPASILALIGDRAAYGAIHGWRHGRRRPALWAVEALAIEHKRRAAEQHQAATDLLHSAYDQSRPPRKGGNPQALRRWRAHRAAEKAKATR